MLLGAALDLKGDYLTTPELSERALVSLDRALALRPDSAEAWRYRGSALITLNRDEEALAAFESALARNPMDASAQSGIARVHFILRGDFAARRGRLRAGPRPQPAGRLERPAARALRDAPPRLPEGRGRGPPRDRAAAGLPLRARGHGARRAPTCASATPSPSQGRHREALEEYAREVEFLRSVDHALRARIFIELHQRIGEAHLRLGEDGGGPGRARPRDRGLRAADAHRGRRRHEPLLRGLRPRAARRDGARPSPASSGPRRGGRGSPPPAPRSSRRSSRCATSRASARSSRRRRLTPRSGHQVEGDRGERHPRHHHAVGDHPVEDEREHDRDHRGERVDHRAHDDHLPVAEGVDHGRARRSS